MGNCCREYLFHCLSSNGCRSLESLVLENFENSRFGLVQMPSSWTISLWSMIWNFPQLFRISLTGLSSALFQILFVHFWKSRLLRGWSGLFGVDLILGCSIEDLFDLLDMNSDCQMPACFSSLVDFTAKSASIDLSTNFYQAKHLFSETDIHQSDHFGVVSSLPLKQHGSPHLSSSGSLLMALFETRSCSMLRTIWANRYMKRRTSCCFQCLSLWSCSKARSLGCTLKTSFLVILPHL